MWGAIFIGVWIGILLTFVFEFFVMGSMVLKVYPSRFGFDETLERLRQAIDKVNWVIVSHELLNDSLKENGVDFRHRVHLLRICRPQYVAELLREKRHVACLMPCTIAVYEKSDGKTEVSKINTGVMGKVIRGLAARVMGNTAAADEEKIMKSVKREA